MDYVFCLHNWNMKKLKGKIIEFVNSGVECLKSRTGVNDQRVSRFCRHRSHSSLVTWNQIRKIITANQAPIVRRVNNAIHWIILYPLDSAIRFLNTYPLESDLSKG